MVITPILAHERPLIGCADSSQVDYTNPESFHHDVNSVAGLLKQFLRDLPDPLFTSQAYSDFIDSARKLSYIPCAEAHS